MIVIPDKIFIGLYVLKNINPYKYIPFILKMEVKNKALELSIDVFSDNPFLLDNLKERARKIGTFGLKLTAASVPAYIAINAAASYIVTNSLVDLVYSSIRGGF